MSQEKSAGWFADGEAYERYVGRWSRPVAKMFLDWLDLAPNSSWTDVGCGTGALTRVILDAAAPARVVGVEPSEEYLYLARSSIDDSRAEFRLGDARALPLESGEVEIAVSGLVLNFVPDQNRAVDEMRRVVGSGNTVAAYVWDYAGEIQLIRYFWTAAAEMFPDAARKDEARLFPICSPGALAGLFQAGGLQRVETHALETPTAFTDFDDYWVPFLSGQGPAGSYCAGLSERERDRLRARLERILPVEDDGTIRLVARAWAVRGTV